MQYVYTVNGRQVTLKKRLPLREGQTLPALIHRASSGEGDTAAQIEMGIMLIESWEFPGDPHDPESYQDLDLFDEFFPLRNALAEHVTARLNPDGAKN